MVKRTMTTNKLERMMDKYTRLLPEWQRDAQRLKEAESTAAYGIQLEGLVMLIEGFVDTVKDDIKEDRKAQATATRRRPAVQGLHGS